MSQENQSSLKFSLEESLWFRKGQEVEELVSISLDPDITIQENDQYVTIRGSLELTGEYKSYHEGNQDEEENLSAEKYVQTIEEREAGICEFSHQFPVDITIPNNRIQSIYDIDVVVESFDYSFPERSCLKLSAELMISGLYSSPQSEVQEQEEAEAAETAETKEVEEEQNVEVLYRTTTELPEDNLEEEEHYLEEEQYEDQGYLFSAEARKTPEEESFAETNSYPNFSYQIPNHEYTQQNNYDEEGRNKNHEHVEITVEKETYEEYTEGHPFASEESSSSSSSSSSHDSVFKKKIKNKIVEKLTKKKSMSLTEFFARKEEGREDQVRLKICIVQKGDTLNRLAERYDISMQKLLQVNNLEMSQDVFEGQVLYIPESMARK